MVVARAARRGRHRDVVFIVVAALLLSTLAGIIPAVMAARLKPVEALRSE